MNIFVSILVQELVGVTRLAVPVVLVACFWPQFLFNVWGRILCALALAIYLFFVNYKAAQTTINQLTFAPSGQVQDQFGQHVSSCGINPQHVRIRYAFTNEMIATSVFDTVSLDPLLWSEIQTDPSCAQATEVLNVHVLPGIKPEAKMRMEKIRAILTPGAQRFLLKHELGHLVDNYSYKKLVTNSIIIFIAAYAGIAVATTAIQLAGGVVSAALGMLLAGTVDIAISRLANRLFHTRAEMAADHFAIHHSPTEDTLAAADFFEKHQAVLDTHTENVLALYLPSEWVLGYPDGKSRAEQLRTQANHPQA